LAIARVDSPIGGGRLIPPTDDVYLIVAEGRRAHDRFETAQDIPNVPYAGVIGRLDVGDTIDLYRVVVGTGSLVLRLGATFGQTSSPAFRLWVFDGLGRLLAGGTAADGESALSIDPLKLGLAAGSTVYVGISPMSGRSAAPAGYQLWFLRGDDSGDPPGRDVESPPIVAGLDAAASGRSVVPPASLTTVSALISPGGSLANLNTPAMGGAPVATAPLPTLSAAPTGGILADGAPTTVLAMRTDAESYPKGDETAAQDDLVGVDEGAELPDEASPLIALQGSDSIPLLGAAALGDWRGDLKDAQVDVDHCSALMTAGLSGAVVAPEPIEVLGTAGCLATACAVPVALAGGPPRWSSNSEDLHKKPGLESAVAATVYALLVDRSTLQEVLDPRQDPDEEPARGRGRRNDDRRLRAARRRR
jgi:hypothetical protein